MKKCINTECTVLPELQEFHSNSSSKDGYRSECKVCVRAKVNARHHTKKGLVTTIYTNQGKSSVKRGHPAPTYTGKELYEWMDNQEVFHNLFTSWVDNGFEKDLTPSCDRLIDEEGYSLDNLRVVTWRDNYMKCNSDRIAGISTSGKVCMAVDQYANGLLINSFVSLREASRETGIERLLITKVCDRHKDHKQTGGFVFRYSGDTDVSFTKKEYGVVQLDNSGNLIAEHTSQREAHKSTGVSYSGIGACCRGEQRSSGKFVWKYTKDYKVAKDK